MRERRGAAYCAVSISRRRPIVVHTDIDSERLTLRPMSAGFLRLVQRGDLAAAEAHIGLSLPEGLPLPPEVVELRLGQLEAQPDQAPWLTRVMALRSERRGVGVIGFHGPPGGEWLDELAPGGVEFGYTVHEAWRRRGFAFEASRALIDWARRFAGVESFVLSMSPGNTASIALARKLGFAQVGTWVHAVRGEEQVHRLGPLDRAASRRREPPTSPAHDTES